MFYIIMVIALFFFYNNLLCIINLLMMSINLLYYVSSCKLLIAELYSFVVTHFIPYFFFHPKHNLSVVKKLDISDL